MVTQSIAAMQPTFETAQHLPGEMYFSPQVAELEKTRIFMKQWLCVARTEDFRNIGDYKALRLFDEPFIVARNESGFSTFANMCLHRGVEIVTGSGNRKHFLCPYHAWSYDLKGRLVRAPIMEASAADLSNRELRQIKTAVWRGCVFINFDPAARSFDESMQPYEFEFRNFRADEVRTATTLEFEVGCNWKFIVENLMDIYHVGMIHAQTFGKYLRIGSARIPFRLSERGLVHLEFDSKRRAADENLPFPLLPWLADQGSAFSSSTSLFPNIKLHVSHDSLRLWRIWPTSPTSTRVILTVMLPRAAFEEPEFGAKIERYSNYVRSIVEEDRVPLESLQRAVGSRNFVPGPLSHLEEGIHHWLKHYVSLIAH